MKRSSSGAQASQGLIVAIRSFINAAALRRYVAAGERAWGGLPAL